MRPPANVNGRACGIELYCGPKALTKDDGTSCLVQWTGYVAGMKRYQGEPLDKDGIKKRFLFELEQSVDPTTDPEFERNAPRPKSAHESRMGPSVALVVRLLRGDLYPSSRIQRGT